MKSLFRVKDLPKLFKTAAKEWYAKDPFRQSAVIAYYAVFSLPALLVLIITAAGFFYDAGAIQTLLLDQVNQTMGQETAGQIKDMLLKANEAKTSVWATILGIATVLIGSTGVFVQLQKSLNGIWEIEPIADESFWLVLKTRLFSFGLILSIAFLLLISLVFSTLLGVASELFKSETSDIMFVAFYILNFIISLTVISALFALIFKFLPDAKITWRQVLIGSIVTGLLFTLGKMAIALYFSKAEPGSGYGAAGSIILILLWVSYSSMILFFGAEFTRAYANMYSQSVPAIDIVKKANNDKGAK